MLREIMTNWMRLKQSCSWLRPSIQVQLWKRLLEIFKIQSKLRQIASSLNRAKGEDEEDEEEESEREREYFGIDCVLCSNFVKFTIPH